MRRRLTPAVGLAIGLVLLVPPAALAHGIAGRKDLPLPEWLFTWSAGVVLLVSFAALAVLWPKPRLEEPGFRPLPEWLGRALTSRAADVLFSLIGVALLVLTIWSGVAGENTISDNFAPTFVFVTFWLGLVLLSFLFGDVFRAFNPWRAIARALDWGISRASGVSGEAEPLVRYPDWLGRWPAAVGLFAFTWLEIASESGAEPRNVAIATFIYTALTIVAMVMFGPERWADRGESFSVYFNLISRVAPFERRERQIGLRPVLGGLPKLDPLPGTVAIVCVMIGTVSFDGLSSGQLWNDIATPIEDSFVSLGLSIPGAREVTAGIGLLLGVLLIATLYQLAIRGVRSVGGGFSQPSLARTFIHTLVPIALVYAAAHYVSLLLITGPTILALLSDPLGHGSDWLGVGEPSDIQVTISANTIWYMQAGFVIAGHVAGLILAHDRALALYDDARQAVRSQYWMLAVMIVFTSFALWLLFQANG